MKKILLLVAAVIAFSGMKAFAQSAGIYESYLILNVSGETNLYYDLNANTENYDFNGQMLGTFCQGSTTSLIFRGGEHKTYKCGCNVSSTRIYYRIYPTGSPSGSYVSNNLPYYSELSGAGSGCNNQMWTKTDYSVNLLSGLTAGNYTMEVYSDASISCQGGTAYASNNGANYKAYFTVSAPTVAGTVSSSQTICSGSTPSALTLSGYTGSIVKWQRSTVSDFSANVTDIANTSATLSAVTIGALTATTYFRAVVKSGECSQLNATPVTITVNTPTVGGSLSNGFSFCTTSNSGTFTLSGYTGSILRWESSPVSDFTSSVTQITNTTTTYNFSNVAVTTYYRAVVQSGVCSQQYSSVKSVTINANSWTGAAGTGWSNPSNWCGGIPTAFDVVTIGAVPNQPVISSGTSALAGSIQLLSGASLTLQSGANLTVTNAVTVASGSTLSIANNANLIQVNNVSNSGIASVTKSSSPLYRLDYTLWSSPVSGQNLLEFSPSTVQNRFYTYSEASDALVYINPVENDFEPGHGYLIRTPNNHPAYSGPGVPGTPWTGTFEGELNNGTITVPTQQTYRGYNLVGNPYASAINIHAFYAGNSGSIESGSALYFWRKRNDSNASTFANITMAAYTANAASGGDTGSSTFTGDPSLWVINPGQGFFVKTSAGNSITFTNSMRRGVNNGQFFRTIQDEADPTLISRLWLNITGANGEFRQAAIAYNSQSTPGIDYGWDGRAYPGDGPVSLYTLAGEETLSIQSRGSFGVSDTVPAGYSVTDPGSYTITLDHYDGVFQQGQDIYLKDNLTDTLTDLKESSYSFTTEAGAINDRFEIWYLPAALDTPTHSIEANQVIVYQKDGEITIDGGSLELKEVTIYDTRGRLLYSKGNINQLKTTINDLVSQHQMLILNITTEKGKLSKKAAI